uniref:Uncharacterized protein n=1 Tax=Anguilla anguilla TaxID=7936 RepID=A0A0E9XLD3_ANGAN
MKNVEMHMDTQSNNLGSYSHSCVRTKTREGTCVEICFRPPVLHLCTKALAAMFTLLTTILA